MALIKVHFPSLRQGKPTIELAGALGAGGAAPRSGKLGQFDSFNAQASRWFALADPDEADVFVYPHRADEDPDQVARVAEQAARRQVGCVFFAWGDADAPVSVPYGAVYRQSLYSDKKLPNERAMPAFCADPRLATGAPIASRQLRPQPAVGFYGFVGNPLQRSLYRLGGRGDKADRLAFRARILKNLARHPAIESKFIWRRANWAGNPDRAQRNPDNNLRDWRNFVANLGDSDYSLAVRRKGNFCYRFYEILAAGRIPIFVNARSVLPFEDEIVWRQQCVWVEESQIDRIGEIVMDFHRSLSPERFTAIQQANRRLWENRLSPLGFYQHALAKAVGKPVEQ
jgi:hypothetical protein